MYNVWSLKGLIYDKCIVNCIEVIFFFSFTNSTSDKKCVNLCDVIDVLDMAHVSPKLITTITSWDFVLIV